MIGVLPWLSLLVGGVVAGGTVALLGCRALRQGRPVVLSTRWFLPSALLLVAIEPVAMLIRQQGDSAAAAEDDRQAVRLFLLVFVAILFAIVAFQRAYSGYSIFGVDIHTVRRALVASLRGLELEYVVREKVYRLQYSGAELVLAEARPRGIVRIHVKRGKHEALLRQIVDAIEVCLRSEEVALARGKCTKWIATGVAIAISCGAGAALLWTVGA